MAKVVLHLWRFWAWNNSWSFWCWHFQLNFTVCQLLNSQTKAFQWNENVESAHRSNQSGLDLIESKQICIYTGSMGWYLKFRLIFRLEPFHSWIDVNLTLVFNEFDFFSFTWLRTFHSNYLGSELETVFWTISMSKAIVSISMSTQKSQ